MKADQSIQELLAVAIEAALRSGAEIVAGLQRSREELDLQSKGGPDLVTNVDRLAEDAIKGTLLARFPHHAILAEESGIHQESGDLLWVVDPLDGTLNFAHGNPHCCVSIACFEGSTPLLGLVYDPVRVELFSTVVGGVPTLNDRPIRVSTVSRISESLVATGFPYDRWERAEVYLEVVAAFMHKVQGIRRMGSAALDLAWLACGRFDGYFEPSLNSWDVSAGAVLVEAAGGRFSDYADKPLDLMNPTHILASNGRIHPLMVDLLRPFSKECRERQ